MPARAQMRDPNRLLVVDDEQPILEAVCDFFSAHGFTVDSARNLSEAEAHITSGRRYALIISDVCLSGGNDRDGLAVIAMARAREPALRVIVVTGHGSVGLATAARASGADLFLEKPVPLKQLMVHANQLLSGAA